MMMMFRVCTQYTPPTFSCTLIANLLIASTPGYRCNPIRGRPLAVLLQNMSFGCQPADRLNHCAVASPLRRKLMCGKRDPVKL